MGILLLGESGSGKSDLALRLIDAGAKLVADDRVNISIQNDQMLASPVSALKGKMEIHGVGILSMKYIHNTVLTIAVTLVPRESVERLPEPAWYTREDIRIPVFSLHAFDASTPAKIRHYLTRKVFA